MSKNDSIISELDGLLITYERVKYFILLSEYYNHHFKVSVSVINELRNALDHVMRAVKNHDDPSDEIEKARGHLYRSAFDACEIIVINRLGYIGNIKDRMGMSNLDNVCPQYRTEFVPEITRIRQDLVLARSSSVSEARLLNYENAVNRLISIAETLEGLEVGNKLFKIQDLRFALLPFAGVIVVVCLVLNLWNLTIPWLWFGACATFCVVCFSILKWCPWKRQK